jgi:hypothetical protein
VSDEDLRFPPLKRREPAKFEPPPWERDQFDELAKTRLEPGPAEGAKIEQPVATAQTATVAEQVAEAVMESARSSSEEPGSKGEGTSADAPKEIDQKHLEVMMMGLRAEEPRPEEAYWKVVTIAGVLCSLIGLAITVWAIVAFATLGKSGARGMTLASVLMLFGLGFAGGGIWVVAKTLRQQGVL